MKPGERQGPVTVFGSALYKTRHCDCVFPVCITQTCVRICQASGLNCVSVWWEERKATKRESEIKQEGWSGGQGGSVSDGCGISCMSDNNL